MGMSEEINNKVVPKLRFPEFRNSGDWEKKTLGEIGEFVGGGTPDTTISEYWDGEIQWFTPTEVKERNLKKSNRTITEIGLKNSSAKLLPKGALLITTRATIGDIGIADDECTTNQGFQSLIVNKSEINIFWYYYIIQNKKELVKKSSGSTFLEIGKNEILKVKALRPSKDEQQKIADCLSSLDDLITAQKQKLEALKLHKKGLMQQLFPAEGETVPKLRFAVFRESRDWEENKLTGEGVASFINEKITNNYLKLETYISTENILPDYAGIMLASKLPAYGSFTKFQKGDILISNIRPYLKKVWFADTNGAASNDIIVIRAGYKINPLFLSFILKNDEFINFIMKSAEGVKMPRGDKDVIKEYPLTFPTQNEQQKIADCLSSLNELISAQKEKIEALKQHKKGLMQQLFPNITSCQL